MRELKKILSGVMAATLILSASACQNQNGSSVASEGTENTTSSENENFNAEGWPVVNEKVSLHVYGSRNSNAYEDYNEYKLLQDMEATTNVHIEWELVEDSTYNDRKTLILTSGSYPDVIMNGVTVEELIRYGDEGVFIPLEDLQEKYCPQLMTAYEQVPALKATNTMPDGHSYSFPTYGDPQFSGLSRLLAINTDWLDAVGMEKPTNLQEFKDVLIAFRDKDPNGNGQQDEIPLSWMGAIYNDPTG